jgi:hypothetical protein
MPVNPLQSHHTAPDTSRASGRAFAAFDVPLPHAGAKPPEIVRELLHHIGMTDADIARFSQQNGYDLVDYSVTAMQKYGGFQTASVHVTREHPQGVARLEIPRADYDALRHFVNGSATSAMPDSTARSARTGGEAYAAHRGINTTAQVRARLDAKLPVSKTSAPQVTSSSTANFVAPTKPVAQMTTTEKLQVAVERAAAHLGPEAAEKLRQLVTPQNLAIMAGTTAALIAVQGVPVLDVVVDAGIVGVAVYTLGTEAIGVIKDLAGFASGVVNAKTEADLDVAGQHMARAVSTVGVDAVATVLLHKAGGAIKERMPPAPAMREMVTPEGVHVRKCKPADWYRLGYLMRSSLSISPSRMEMTRCARAAMSGSCVTTMIVFPSAWSRSKSAIISWLVLLSSAPVGSSASRIEG